MNPFTTYSGVGVPLRRSNVDTDQIISAQYMKLISRSGFGRGLFEGWRADPEFVLNRDEYRGGSILVAGSDFGTGSSREHAVWALMDYGFRAVVAPRFGDIFRTNAAQQGLVAAVCSQADVETLWKSLESSPGAEATVDLVAKQVAVADVTVPFAIDDYTRWRLIEGLDDIGLTLRHVEAIEDFERRRPAWKPTTLPINESGVPAGSAG